MKKKRKRNNEALWVGAIFIIMIIVLGYALRYGHSNTEKKMEKACNEKAETIESMKGCKYLRNEYVKGDIKECFCIKDSQIKSFVLEGKEVPT